MRSRNLIFNGGGALGFSFFRRFQLLVFIIMVQLSCVHAATPDHKIHPLTEIVYLTFEEIDTSRTMTVNFHSYGEAEAGSVYFDEVSRGGQLQDYRTQVKGRTQRIPEIDMTYHHVKLDNLKPNTTYYFAYGSHEIGFSKELKFRTLPSDSSNIRIVNGGDIGTKEDFSEVSKDAMAMEPHVILIGGDIAYANGDLKRAGRWKTWFQIMKKVTTTPQGYLVPLIVAIGNHEVDKSIALPGAKSPFYDNYFAQDKRTYFVRQLGADTMLFVLDSGHRALPGGYQRSWIKKQFQEYSHFKNRIAMYHVPLYPSHRPLNDTLVSWVRFAWKSLFSDHHLTVGLEHHDHALKRTKVLSHDKESPKGTVFIGDGCWGKNGREVFPERDYLEVVAAEPHVWYIETHLDKLTFKAMGFNNQVFDHFELYNTPEKTQVRNLLK